MADESLGTARIDVIVGTASMDAGIEATKNKMAGLGAQAEAQFNQASGSSKRYAESLLRQAEMLGKTRAEQIAYNAQTRIGGELGDKIAAQAMANQVKMSASASHIAGEATKAFSGTNKSARELQFAMRGLPAQFTDIFTSLASGQRPMMVLLQQGGQIKDLFGGVSPALRAMGSGILAMINPLTITAGAIAALGFAWKSAEDDASAFNKALLVTGGYAGKTSMQLEAMVESIAHTANVSQGSAREALQKVAESGRFTGDQFNLVAVAAARMESATGQSIDSAIKKFEELGKSPVDALLKLNETEHFLTEAQLDRVRALAAEGKEQEAAAEAARIYAGRLDEVAAAAEAARPHLASMWKDAKDGASAAWEETKRFTEFLAAAADKSKELPWWQKFTAVGAIRSLYGAEPTMPANIAPVAGAIDSNQAKAAIKLQEDAAKFKDRYLTREQEKTRELAELDKLRAQYSEQEYQNLKKQIDLKFTDKTPTASRTKAPRDFRVQDMAQIRAEIEAEGKLMDQRQRGEAAVAAYKTTLDDMLQTRQAQIDLDVASFGMGQREIEQTKARIAIDADYNRKAADLQKRQQSTSDAVEKQFYAQQLADLKAYHDARVKMEEEGSDRESKARANAMDGANAAIKDFIDEQNDIAGQSYRAISKAFDGFSDAFADFASGAESARKAFGSLVDSMYRDALKFLANQAMRSFLEALGFRGSDTPPSVPSGASGAGGWASLLASAAGSLFGPGTIGAGLANGGPAAAGSIHPVVENGPELLSIGSRNYLMMGGQSGHVTPIRDGGESSKRSPTYVTNINVQPTSTRRTAQQIATANARTQRIAQSRNG